MPGRNTPGHQGALCRAFPSPGSHLISGLELAMADILAPWKWWLPHIALIALDLFCWVPRLQKVTRKMLIKLIKPKMVLFFLSFFFLAIIWWIYKNQWDHLFYYYTLHQGIKWIMFWHMSFLCCSHGEERNLCWIWPEWSIYLWLTTGWLWVHKLGKTQWKHFVIINWQ